MTTAMKLHIRIHNKDVQLRVDGESRAQWTDNNDLLEKFFPALDDVLTRAGATFADVTDVTLATDMPHGYTTARIARTIVHALRFAAGLPAMPECDEESVPLAVEK